MIMSNHKYHALSLRRAYNKSLRFYSGFSDLKNPYAFICAAPINCAIYAEWDNVKNPLNCDDCENCPYEIIFDWEEC